MYILPCLCLYFLNEIGYMFCLLCKKHDVVWHKWLGEKVTLSVSADCIDKFSDLKDISVDTL